MAGGSFSSDASHDSAFDLHLCDEIQALLERMTSMRGVAAAELAREFIFDGLRGDSLQPKSSD
ncbi:hypothetical protein [Nocardia gipuzkoensis]